MPTSNLGEHERSALLAREIDNPRPLIPVSLERFSRGDPGGRRHVPGHRRGAQRTAPGSHRNLCDLRSGSSVGRAGRPPPHEGVRAGGTGRIRRRLVDRAALRAGAGTARRPRDHGDAPWPPRLSASAAGTRGHPGGHDRLFRLEQGDRVPRFRMGPLPGAAGPDRDYSRRKASVIRSFTAEAARLGAAAVRPTSPFWRFRRVR